MTGSSVASGEPLVAAGDSDVGEAMHALIERLYPYPRSLTGDGVRRTLRNVAEHIDLSIREVPTGTPAFDWTVPREWNIRDAWIADAEGRRVVDFGDSNLHVVGYSVPVRERLSLAELRPHLHTLPDRPDWIPYRTSYWEERWGFCLAHRTLESMEEGEYEVVIDSSLEEGHLTYGELHLPGETDREVIVHTHVCHPSTCNDNLSGIAVATFLARELAARRRRRLSYRFLFLPGLIGAVVWLSRNEERLGRVAGGLVLSNLGDPAGLSYKRSRRGESEIDRAAVHVLSQREDAPTILDFEPYGYDERQYCSPGIDLPVGALSRSRFGEYPEYHTSADDLDLVRPHALADSLAACRSILDVLEGDGTYVNLNPKCEPQLGRRGLYDAFGEDEPPETRMALLWVLNLSDGRHSLLDVARRAGLPFAAVRRAADALLGVDLLAEAGERPPVTGVGRGRGSDSSGVDAPGADRT